jgi:chaperonin GroES
MTVNITPLHDRVLVRRLEQKETAKGGIVIPDTAKEKPQEGEVIAVGAGKVEKGRRVPLDVKVGDRILFGKYTGNDIKIDDQESLAIRCKLDQRERNGRGRLKRRPAPEASLQAP